MTSESHVLIKLIMIYFQYKYLKICEDAARHCVGHFHGRNGYCRKKPKFGYQSGKKIHQSSILNDIELVSKGVFLEHNLILITFKHLQYDEYMFYFDH